MQDVIRDIQVQYSLNKAEALRLFDQISDCYVDPDNSVLAIERSEFFLPLEPCEHFTRKWIALYPTVVVIVGETARGTRGLLRIAEIPKPLLT